MPLVKQSNPTQTWPKRLLRHAIRFLLTMALLLGPNLVFYGRWAYPDQILPTVTAARVDQWVAPGVSKTLVDNLMADVRGSREREGLPSVSAAIAFDGQLQWAGASGFAEIETDTAATVRSRYRTGSVAKPITAVALVRLAEAGEVAMDAPISQYVPGLPTAMQPLTARLLASHRAGIRHYALPAWWMGWHENYSTRHFATVAEGLTLFIDDPLRSQPGTEFKYSTFGYSLLSRLMEGATDLPFPQVLAETVFAPAGMLDTAVDAPGHMPNRVAFYQAKDGRYTRSHPIDSSYKIAGGGLVSTPSDLARLGALLLGEGFVSTQAKTMLWTPLALADGRMNPENYAIGWRVDTSTRLLGEARPTRLLHHGGAQQGAAAFIMLLPEHNIAVAAMSNSGTPAARQAMQEVTYALARRVLGERATDKQ